MKKDKTKSVRVNSQVIEALEKRGWSAQSLIDWAISQHIDVNTTIKVKKGKAG